MRATTRFTFVRCETVTPSLHLVTLGNIFDVSRDIGRVKQSQLPSGVDGCVVYSLVKQGKGGWSREKQNNVHKMQTRYPLSSLGDT